MEEHPNAALYRQLVTAFRDGDVETVGKALAPDLRWYEPGNPVPLDRDEVLRQLTTASQELQGRVDLHDVFGDDEHVVAMIRVALRRPDGAEVDYPAVEVTHLVDGRISERWSFMDACPAPVTEFFDQLA